MSIFLRKNRKILPQKRKNLPRKKVFFFILQAPIDKALQMEYDKGTNAVSSRLSRRTPSWPP